MSELSYSEYGEGEEIVIFLHGLNVGARAWENIHPYLPTNYHYYELNLPGVPTHSTIHSFRMSFFDIEQDLLRETERTIGRIAGKRKVHLVGHSTGGWIGLRIAERKNIQLASLLVIAPYGLGEQIPLHERWLANSLFAYFLSHLIFPPTSKRIRTFLSQPMFAENKKRLDTITLDSYIRSIQQNYEFHPIAFMHRLSILSCTNKLERIDPATVFNNQLPTLFVFGANDPFNSWKYITQLQQLQPQSVCILPDCGHIPPIEQPGRFATILKEHLLRQHA